MFARIFNVLNYKVTSISRQTFITKKNQDCHKNLWFVHDTIFYIYYKQ